MDISWWQVYSQLGKPIVTGWKTDPYRYVRFLISKTCEYSLLQPKKEYHLPWQKYTSKVRKLRKSAYPEWSRCILNAMCPYKREAAGALSQTDKEKTEAEGRATRQQAKEDRGTPAAWKLEAARNGCPPQAPRRKAALPTPRVQPNVTTFGLLTYRTMRE